MEIKAITPIQQFGILRHEFPESSGTIQCGTMTWFGEFTPSALSDTYKLKITYKLGQAPKAFIISPKLCSWQRGLNDCLTHTTIVMGNNSYASICRGLANGDRQWL